MQPVLLEVTVQFRPSRLHTSPLWPVRPASTVLWRHATLFRALADITVLQVLPLPSLVKGASTVAIGHPLELHASQDTLVPQARVLRRSASVVTGALLGL